MDQAHAHPSSDPARPFSRLCNKHPGFRSSLSAPSSVRQPPPRVTQFKLQNQRLQLRNTGFRAPSLPSDGISARFSNLRAFHEQADLDDSPECKSSPKSPIYYITSKNTSIPYRDSVSPILWYQNTPSAPLSPTETGLINDYIDDMKLRDISGNEQRTPPPLSSPLAKHMKGRKKRGLDLRKTSFQASQYIEHIENELEEVKSSLQSPNTGTSLHDRLRSQKVEISELKQTVSGLEKDCEERVKQAVEHMASTEFELRKRIKAMEDELAQKDDTIRYLETHKDQSLSEQSCIDSLKATIERLEVEKCGLEDANRTIEKRNDILAELLGHSPTRTHHGFELASPVRKTAQQTPRPKSLISSKVPSSPCTAYLCRPMSVQASPGARWSPLAAIAQEHVSPSMESNFDPQKKPDDLRSLDSGLGESCSEQKSNHSSLLSNPSVSAWGGPPMSSSPADESAGSQEKRKRKTRRFASGSTSLKPLVLPAMAAANNLAHSTPCRRRISEQSIDPTTSFLSQPFDIYGHPPVVPNPSISSHNFDIHGHPPVQSQSSSAAWASEDALKALEGESEHFSTFEEVLAQHGGIFPGKGVHQLLNDVPEYLGDEPDEDPMTSCKADDIRTFADLPSPSMEEDHSFSSLAGEVSSTDFTLRDLSSDEENFASLGLEVEVPASALLEKHTDTDNHCTLVTPIRQPTFDLNSSPESSECQTMFELSNPGVATASLRRVEQPPPGLALSHNKTQNSEYFSDVKDVRNNTSTKHSRQSTTQRQDGPLKIPRHTTASPVPITSITARTIFGTISKYTSYVREVRRDPSALARRVIANAWRSNWKRLGWLSWWVLGLFIGSGLRRKEFLERTCGLAWDWDQYCAEDIAERTHDEMNGPGPTIVMDESLDLRLPSTPVPPRPDSRLLNKRRVKFHEYDEGYRTSGTRAKAKPAIKTDAKGREEKKSMSWGKSLYLWGKFSVAIMLAIGGAVVKGPGEMLKDCNLQEPSNQTTESQCHSKPNDSKQARPDYDQIKQLHHPVEYKAHDTALEAHEGDLPATASCRKSRLLNVISPAKAIVTDSPQKTSKKSLLAASEAEHVYSFGTPSHNEWDRYEDNRRARPAMMRPEEEPGRLHDIYGPDDLANDATACGELTWMASLSISDFEAVDQDATIRPRKNNFGAKRTLSLIS